MAAMPAAKDKAEYETWFREADKNNDGFLTSKELKKMFKVRGYKTSSKQFKQQFASLDKDGDKKITIEEYLIGMGQIPGLEHKEAEIRKAFEKADKNGDGKLDLDEMKEVLKDMKTGLNNKELFDIMHKADKNRSGTVDYNEFLMLFLREQGHFE